jgi:hypothetical protein
VHPKCASKSKQLLLSLALAAVGGLEAGDRRETPSVTAVALTVYTDFQEAVPSAVSETMRSEVESMFAPAEFRLEWSPLADFRAERASTAVVVAHFEGRCDSSRLVMRPSQAGSLGWTEISDGAILPFVHVDCARARNYLQTALLGYRSKDRERLYGRALGRVLAHELYHVFTLSSRHGAVGVARKSCTVQNLLDAGFQFSKKEIETLRQRRAMAGLK